MITPRPLSFNRRRGFTLVEIILVVAIIMTLVGLVGPRLADKAKRARIASAKMQINNFKTTLGEFEVHADRYPTTAEGFKALLERPSDLTEAQWEGPYLAQSVVPKDPWGTEYRFVSPSQKKGKDYDITSAGPDKKFETADDISNDAPGANSTATSSDSTTTAK